MRRTKTRGARHQPEARPAGEGRYAVVRHDDHTHLAYALELPAEPGEPQELDIEPEASYIIAVKNPDKPSPPGVGLGEGREASFPERLAERFGERRFADVDPPEFLDHEGAELVLIAAAEDVSDELGVRLHTETETAASAELFKELKMGEGRRSRPVTEGEWK